MALVLKCFASTNSIVFGWLKFSFEQATFRALTVELAGAFQGRPSLKAQVWQASLIHGFIDLVQSLNGGVPFVIMSLEIQ